MSVNGASTIFGLASWTIWGLQRGVNPWSTYRLPGWAKMLLTISHPPTTIERSPSIDNFCGGSVSYTAKNCIASLPNWVLRGQSFQSVLVYNFTNMHAMSHRSDFFACSCRVNIWEPAVCFTVSLALVVFRVALPRFLIPTAMSDSKSLNMTLLEVMILSKNERVFICDLSDLTLQIVSNAWWASIEVGSKRPIAWNNSRHAPSWRFNWHCGIEGTGSPGIICIVCHQVLRHPSDHGTSSTGKHLLATAHIAKLNELTESEVTELTSSTVEETALAIPKRQGSRGITMVCSQRRIIFHIHVDLYWPKWKIKCSELAAKDFETSKFHQDRCNRYLMLGFVLAHVLWNAISNLELRRSYKVLRNDPVLPSATTPGNICRREYAPTVDGIKKQLPSRDKVGLALDWLTSLNKLAITSVIAYYMDRNWALRGVQLAFDEVDRLFFSPFAS